MHKVWHNVCHKVVIKCATKCAAKCATKCERVQQSVRQSVRQSARCVRQSVCGKVCDKRVFNVHLYCGKVCATKCAAGACVQCTPTNWHIQRQRVFNIPLVHRQSVRQMAAERTVQRRRPNFNCNRNLTAANVPAIWKVSTPPINKSVGR